MHLITAIMTTCMIAAEPPVEGELPAAAQSVHEEAVAAFTRGDLERADALVVRAYGLVDRTPADALMYRRGRDVLLGTRRVVLYRLAQEKDEPAPLCVLRAFLERHRDRLVRALGPSLLAGELEGIHERIREVDEELLRRAVAGKQAACSSPEPPVTAPAGHLQGRPRPDEGAQQVEARSEPTPTVAVPVVAQTSRGDAHRHLAPSEPGLQLRRAGGVVLATSSVPWSVMIFGIMGYARAVHEMRSINVDTDDPASTRQEIQQTFREGVTFRALAIASGAVGAVMTSAGIALIVRGRRADRKRLVHATLMPSFGGLAVRGVF